MRLGFSLYLLCIALAGATILSAGAPARAQGASAASQWQTTPYSRARLVAGAPLKGEAGRHARLGVQIRLDPGWKTYWRVPGDAGVPPVFDFQASDNVAEATVAWPAPGRFIDAFATTLGYQDEVIFPVTVRPQDPARPVVVRLTLGYAVCKDICIPAEAKFSLRLGADLAGDPYFSGLIDGYRAKVPRALPADAVGLAARAETHGGGTRLVVSLEPPGEGVPELFVEGPDAFYFATPEVRRRADGAVEYVVPVGGVTEDAPLAGATLRVTLVGDATQTEHELVVR